MALVALDIENYQALGSAGLELGQFTVVTGPTGAGKSAVIRALRLAVFNQKGTSFIRHGQKSCKVMLADSDGLALVLVRGGRDAYVLDVLGEQKTFTKLGGQVPAEIAELLNFSELNFAGQFDRPYLLDSSGGQIARMLGKLTNVDLVFEAARRGYAQKQEMARRLRSTQAELEQLTEQAERYADLPARLAAMAEAEKHAETCQRGRERMARLFALMKDAVNGAEAVAEARGGVQAVQPPSLDTLDSLVARRDRLGDLLYEALQARNAIVSAEAIIGALREQEITAHDQVHDALVEAGTCPTCGLAVPR
jgi:DNA repair ATPase RecN